MRVMYFALLYYFPLPWEYTLSRWRDLRASMMRGTIPAVSATFTGRCNHVGQAVAEEPDQGFPTWPSGYGLELQPPNPPRVVKGD